MIILGFDIGGSTIKSGLVSKVGRVSNFQEVPTNQHLDQILLEIKKRVRSSDKFSGIGICVPAIIDKKTQFIQKCLNIPGLNNIDLIHLVSPIIPINPIPPISLMNDADAALLGEHWIGAAKKYKNVVMLTLGTGVGGAAMIDGQLLPHPDSLEGEIGHWQVDADDKFSCNVGVAGSVEVKIGGYCVVKRYKHTLEELAAKARAGDDTAQNHFTDISYWFHAALEKANDRYHPDIFVIGGSGAESLDLFLGEVEPIKPVIKAELSHQAGVIGAAHFAMISK